MDSSGPSRRPFKRRRVDAYPRGSVLRVEVHNFMTYKDAVIEPGPKLNLVLGPNGTGKSSLVCAICVGLAGKTTLLGRAEDVSSFVRRGAASGWVQITLSSGDPMRPHVVRRELQRDTNSSQWVLNGQQARMRDVEELVRDKLKIQLDNLCQFLPQDKVVEFARMSPVDLLAATEKAIGNGELYEQHQELVRVRSKLEAHDMDKAALEESVAQLKAENARNTRDVENIQRRQQLLQEVELAQKKLPWVAFEQRRREYERDKEMREAGKRELAKRRGEQAEEAGPLAARRALLERLRADKQHMDGKLRAADARLVGSAATRGREAQLGVEDEINVLLEDVAAKAEEIAGLATAAAARERRIEQLQREVGQLEGEVAALPPPGDAGEHGAARSALLREQNDVAMQISALSAQEEELREAAEAVQQRRRQAEEKVRRIDDSKLRRLQALDQRCRGIGQLWQWLQANRGRFRGPVYGPIAVEVECPDPQHLQYLEQQVAGNVWAFFVTQFREDQDLLELECRALTGGRFRPAIANYAGDVSGPILHPRGEASDYARYGISQTLDSVFTAPAVVKRVLCDEARVNEAYCGDRGTQVEQLLRDCDRVQMVYTPDAAYRRTRSQYNRTAESTMVSDLRPPRILAGAATADDGREREAAQAEMMRCAKELEELEGRVQEQARHTRAKQGHQDKLRVQVAALDQRIREAHQRHTALRTALRSKRGELERVQRQPDPRQREPRLRVQLEELRGGICAKAVELLRLQAGQAQLLADVAALDLSLREAAMQCDKLAEAAQRRAVELREWELKVERLAAICSATANECRRLKQAAEAACDMTPEVEAAWAAANDGEGLPESRDELQAFIDTRAAEADGMLVQNPAALRQYNERCRQIADQERELEALEEARGVARAAIDGVKSRWLPELQRVVAAVNATFSANFSSVGCAGDVVLHEAEGEDFEKYAIEIRVKFRDSEELQTLDANRQSGGERSVSTILYLIALQGVSVTPFRVVDEINQGMDPVNERKVFVQLVHAACRPGTPQCFLLTPKLLPDLPFSPDVAVLQIMNGGHIKEVACDFRMESLLGGRRMALLAAA